MEKQCLAALDQTRSEDRVCHEEKVDYSYFRLIQRHRIIHPCYTRSVTAPSVGLVAKVNGWLFFVRLFHSLFQAGLSRRFH